MFNKQIDLLKNMKAASSLIALSMIGTGVFLLFYHLFCLLLSGH